MKSGPSLATLLWLPVLLSLAAEHGSEAFMQRVVSKRNVGRLLGCSNDGRLLTPLYQASASDDSDNSKARVRFSGTTSTATTTNPLDKAISIVSSDVASIGLGLLGLCLLLIERLTLPDAATLGEDPLQYAEKLGEETRSNLIAVIACGSVLLNGLSKLDVTSALAEAVVLEGTTVAEPLWFDDADHANEAAVEWGMESLLKATPARTVVILRSTTTNGDPWQVIAMMGTIPTDTVESQGDLNLPKTPILDRCKKADSAETYLPTLQALPGKAEFAYLPSNTQEVLILPVPATTPDDTSTAMAIVLGSNCAKSFTPRDVAWCQTIASRVGSKATSQ